MEIWIFLPINLFVKLYQWLKNGISSTRFFIINLFLWALQKLEPGRLSAWKVPAEMIIVYIDKTDWQITIMKWVNWNKYLCECISRFLLRKLRRYIHRISMSENTLKVKKNQQSLHPRTVKSFCQLKFLKVGFGGSQGWFRAAPSSGNGLSGWHQINNVLWYPQGSYTV